MPGYLSFAHMPPPVVVPPSPTQLFLTAARTGDFDTVREMVLNNGVQVDVGDVKALNLAADNGHEQIVIFLLQRGADINYNHHIRSTALNRAILRGHENTMILLISRGADLTIEDYDGRPALSIAARTGNTQIVQQLLASGAPINFVNTSIAGTRSTALTEAIQKGSLETVELLVEQGADVNLDHGLGLQHAIATGKQEIVAYLQAQGAILPPAQAPAQAPAQGQQQGGSRARTRRRRSLRRRSRRGRRALRG
jgi:ankyrin repeat protein